jgi:glycosyltransferase involved in cell wall biosynthesis
LHNRIKKNEFKNYDKLLKLSDKILIHCEDSYEELKKLKSYNLFKSRIVLIPHPNYCNYIKYTSKNHRSMFNFKEDDIVFMFHGLIEKRKRIENLIDIFKNINNNNIHLLIVGNVTFFKKAYAKKLAALMKGIPNIHYRYGYIKDEEFNSWFNTSDIEIFTPNVNHQLNSASIMYSLSNKKTFISPDFGTVNSFKDKTFFFHFDSTSNNLHDSIIEIVNNIAKNYNRKKLLQMGEKAYEYVSKHNSIELFISELKEFYK